MSASGTSPSRLVWELRASLGETQTEFAKRIHVAKGTVVRYETGAQIPNARMLKTLADLSKRKGLKDLSALLSAAVERRLSEAKLARSEARRNAALWTIDSDFPSAATPENTYNSGPCTSFRTAFWREAHNHLKSTPNFLSVESDFDAMVAVVLADLAVEQYVLYLDDFCFPAGRRSEWDSSNYRATPDIRSTIEKITKAKCIVVSQSLDPYVASVVKLRDLRNRLPHPDFSENHNLGRAEVAKWLDDVAQYFSVIYRELRSRPQFEQLLPFIDDLTTKSAEA